MGHPSPRSGTTSPSNCLFTPAGCAAHCRLPSKVTQFQQLQQAGFGLQHISAQLGTAWHSLAAGPTVLLSPGAIFQCFSSLGEMLCLLHGMPPHCHFCLPRGEPWHYHTLPARSETHTASGDTLKILCQCWLGAHRDRLAQPNHPSPWHRDHLQLRQSSSTGASVGNLGMGGNPEQPNWADAHWPCALALAHG